MKFNPLLMAVSIVFFLSLSAAAAANASPRTALQADYNALYADARHKDVSCAMRYFASDFIGIDHTNNPPNSAPSLNKKTLFQVAQDVVYGSQSIRGNAVITKLVVKGDEATVTVRHHAVIIVSSGHGHIWRGVFDAVTKDTWIHGPSGWQMQKGRGMSLHVIRHQS